jgi:8-oxo-dGTP diphosphatase
MEGKMLNCQKCQGPIDQVGKSISPVKVAKFTGPSIATDAMVLRKHKTDDFHDILLITRGRPPFKGRKAFPGGFVDYNEEPLVGCIRELDEECNLKGKNPVLVTVAGDPKRDPRKHIVSIVYKVDVDEDAQAKAGDDAATAKFYNLREELKIEDNFAFDHYTIIKEFIEKTYPQYLKP